MHLIVHRFSFTAMMSECVLCEADNIGEDKKAP